MKRRSQTSVQIPHRTVVYPGSRSLCRSTMYGNSRCRLKENDYRTTHFRGTFILDDEKFNKKYEGHWMRKMRDDGEHKYTLKARNIGVQVNHSIERGGSAHMGFGPLVKRRASCNSPLELHLRERVPVRWVIVLSCVWRRGSSCTANGADIYLAHTICRVKSVVATHPVELNNRTFTATVYRLSLLEGLRPLASSLRREIAP